MQVFEMDSANTGGRHVVLLFGMGMIGSSIRDSLKSLGFQLVDEFYFSWNDSAKRECTFSLIEKLCLDFLPALECVSVVWSAGAGGFYSTDEEVRKENCSFVETMGFFTQLKIKLDPVRFNMHYLSSAGGLFEGQRVVDRSSLPAPLRPYGRLKLEQEEILQRSLFWDSVFIYRPSSVYGPMKQKTKKGLISNLIYNGRNGLVTVLDAHVMSLRDYVFSGDVGRFIARLVGSKKLGLHGCSIFFLVSARCSSIYEVVLKIERTLNMTLNVRYDESFGNNTNITFSGNVLPPGWTPSPLNVGIRQFLVEDYSF